MFTSSSPSAHHHAHPSVVSRALRLFGPAPRLPNVGVGTLAMLVSLRKQRQALKHLDVHLLRDIGLDAGEAENEATRPIWDVPQNWRS